jgi:hypothetical protein
MIYISKEKKFKCSSEAQKKAIRRSYAIQNNKHVKVPYPHFRNYKVSKHPALILDEFRDKEDKERYHYRDVTHEAKHENSKNEIVKPNPNPKDKNPMYIQKRVRNDVIYNFDNYPLKWKYPKK